MNDEIDEFYMLKKNYMNKKTNRCITIEECFPVCSIGNHLSASIMENVFDYLDAPVINLSGKDVPMPYAKNLEKEALVTMDEILSAIKKVTKGK